MNDEAGTRAASAITIRHVEWNVPAAAPFSLPFSAADADTILTVE